MGDGENFDAPADSPGAGGLPDGLESKAARDLTLDEARQLILYWQTAGRLTLGGGDTFPSALHYAPIEFPLNGVRFFYFDIKHLAGLEQRVRWLDARLAVALYRLTAMLNSRWGVNRLDHIGLGASEPTPAGRGKSQYNAHNSGRAIDLGRLEGTITPSIDYPNNGTYKIAVRKNWGEQPIFLPDGTKLPSTKLPAKVHPFYRLFANPDNMEQDLAYLIFLDIYRFAAAELAYDSDARDGNRALPDDLTAVQPGEFDGYIVHPDYGDVDQRAAHIDHYHLQIGPTGFEATPPRG